MKFRSAIVPAVFPAMACLATALTLMLASCATTDTPAAMSRNGSNGAAPGPVMASILKERQRGPHGLSSLGLPHVRGEAGKPLPELPAASDDRYEVVSLPADPQQEDGTIHRVVLERLTDKYWIVRSTGHSVAPIIFGPGCASTTCER